MDQEKSHATQKPYDACPLIRIKPSIRNRDPVTLLMVRFIDIDPVCHPDFSIYEGFRSGLIIFSFSRLTARFVLSVSVFERALSLAEGVADGWNGRHTGKQERDTRARTAS